MSELVTKLFAIHDALTATGLAHAFGGAIALAYCTEEPRGTRDLDLNIFTDSSRAEMALAALPDGISVSTADVDAVVREGQTRLWWDDTPIDVFLNNHPFHDAVAGGVIWVPLERREIPVLDCASLVVFKALFNRTRDWADIEAVSERSPGDIDKAAAAIEELLGPHDPIHRQNDIAHQLSARCLPVILRAARIALGAAVGLVLADSSVVVLALPDIYRELDVSVAAVTWVLIGFNLVLAASAVPAAHAASRVGPARLTAAGLGLFAVASLGCGLAPSIGVLIAARCLQAVGGAAAVCAALELMPAVYGSERSATRAWATAGAAGAALGPAVGGLLTELVSWQSIFLVQVPAAILLAVPIIGAARGEATRRDAGAAGRPHLAANAALGLISAALAAALFLVVLMLIEGWRLSPIAAAAAVSVLPACALLSAPLARRVPAVEARAAAGAILIAGGLAALGLLPNASVVLTFPPQALVGVGLALTLSALTEAALAGRAPQAIHGGWTIASRHAGVVVGLLLLTPVFTADLETERADAEAAGTAALLDARLSPGAKLELADRIAKQIEAEGDKVPTIAPAFEPLPSDPAERVETVALRARIEDEVDAAATHAFSASFLIAAAFAVAALIPIAIARRRVQL